MAYLSPATMPAPQSLHAAGDAAASMHMAYSYQTVPLPASMPAQQSLHAAGDAIATNVDLEGLHNSLRSKIVDLTRRSSCSRALMAWMDISTNTANVALLEAIIQRVEWYCNESKCVAMEKMHNKKELRLQLLDAMRSEFKHALPFVKQLIDEFDADFLNNMEHAHMQPRQETQLTLAPQSSGWQTTTSMEGRLAVLNRSLVDILHKERELIKRLGLEVASENWNLVLPDDESDCLANTLGVANTNMTVNSATNHKQPLPVVSFWQIPKLVQLMGGLSVSTVRGRLGVRCPKCPGALVQAVALPIPTPELRLSQEMVFASKGARQSDHACLLAGDPAMKEVPDYGNRANQKAREPSGSMAGDWFLSPEKDDSCLLDDMDVKCKVTRSITHKLLEVKVKPGYIIVDCEIKTDYTDVPPSPHEELRQLPPVFLDVFAFQDELSGSLQLGQLPADLSSAWEQDPPTFGVIEETSSFFTAIVSYHRFRFPITCCDVSDAWSYQPEKAIRFKLVISAPIDTIDDESSIEAEKKTDRCHAEIDAVVQMVQPSDVEKFALAEYFAACPYDREFDRQNEELQERLHSVVRMLMFSELPQFSLLLSQLRSELLTDIEIGKTLQGKILASVASILFGIVTYMINHVLAPRYSDDVGDAFQNVYNWSENLSSIFA